jgi:hypothetical protein
VGLKDGRSHLSRDRAIASVGRKPLGDEGAVGEAKEDAPVQVQRLMERVLERSNLLQALRQVKSNAGSPGVDGMSVDALSGHLRQHWPDLHQRLHRGRTSLCLCTVGPLLPSRRVFWAEKAFFTPEMGDVAACSFAQYICRSRSAQSAQFACKNALLSIKMPMPLE